jgi:hypothetical protein
MKKLLSLIGLSLVLTNAAFAQDLLSCADFKKMGHAVEMKVIKERENIEMKLVAKIVNRAAKEGRLSDFDRDILLLDSKNEVLEGSRKLLDRSIKCLNEEIKEIDVRIGHN